MFTKVLIAAVLIAFVGVQLAYSLKCYSCGNPEACNKAGKITCDEKNANETTKLLKNYFTGVSEKINNNYECLHWNGTDNKAHVEFKGCIYTHIDACNLGFIKTGLTKKMCKKCAGELCNGSSPAGTYSSSAYTLMASAVMILIAKFVVF